MMWKIKEEVKRQEGEYKGKLLVAIQALILMMDIRVSDNVFRQLADKNPELYKYFEKL